jgi:hypothetical protein
MVPRDKAVGQSTPCVLDEAGTPILASVFPSLSQLTRPVARHALSYLRTTYEHPLELDEPMDEFDVLPAAFPTKSFVRDSGWFRGLAAWPPTRGARVQYCRPCVPQSPGSAYIAPKIRSSNGNKNHHPVHCHPAFWRPNRRSHATCPHFQVYIHHLFQGRARG